MNVWDLLTWLSAAGLAGGTVVIFAFFLKDARSILGGSERDRDRK